MNSKFNIRRLLVFILTLTFTIGSLLAVGNRPTSNTPSASASVRKNSVSKDPGIETLRGEDAITQLKQRGTYGSLVEAMNIAAPPPLWQQQAQLTADDGASEYNLGGEVAISGNTAIVGRKLGGAAYIFVRNGAIWSLQQKLTENQDDFGLRDIFNFGGRVAISGDTVLVAADGAEVENDNGGINLDQGVVYVYVRSGSAWSLQQKLTPSEPRDVGNYFGNAVAISGNTAIIGTRGIGAFIFERAGTAWTQQTLTPSFLLNEPDPRAYERFGDLVAISGETAIVYGIDALDFVPEDGSKTSAYVFVRNGATWTENQKLAVDDFQVGDAFVSLSISDDTVIVGYSNFGYSCASIGEPCDTDHVPDPARQGAYVFVRSGGAWSQQDKLDVIDPISQSIRPSVAISGENAIVGFHNISGFGGDVGQAYLYTRTNGTWFYQQTFVEAEPAADDGFGWSVAISGGTAIVGAPFDDVGVDDEGSSILNNGSAYVFVRSPDTDGDGLPDDWEENGVEIDGEFIDLPEMGADPMHKDVFVHADWMAPSPAGVVLKPDPTAIKMVMDAFADAPVDNPDGEEGINLHVDLGPDSIMDPATDVTWGFNSRAGETAFQPELGTLNADDGNYEWIEFDVVKAERFDGSKRKAIFHYAVFCDTFAGTPYSGISRGNVGPAADFLVSVGRERNAVSPGGTVEHVPAGGTVLQQAGTFMHELGHNLGLKHGGGDNIKFKPNYLSVMNYFFQFSGLLELDGQRTLDYSSAELPALNQSLLDESVGIGDFGEHFTLWNGPSRPDVPTGSNKCLANENGYYKLFSPGIGLDWNCDGELTLEPVSVRVVTDPTPPAPPNPDVLNGFNDWANLTYDGGGRIGDLGFGGSGLTTTQIDELPVEQILSALPPALLDEETAAPHDVVTVKPQTGSASLTVNFDGSASTSVTGTIVNWSWNFGDGSTGSGPTVQHIYTLPGIYFVSLNVTDSNGKINLVPLRHRITVGTAPSPTPNPTPDTPNLTPYQPNGWTDKLVVSNTTGTNTDSSPLLARDALYLDLAIINNGNGATGASFAAKIYVDDVEIHSFIVNPPLNAAGFTFLEDFPLGSLTAGEHSIKILADANGEIAESDETDNEYTKSITISPSTAAFVSRQDGDWSDPCTWNLPVSPGNCGSSIPGAADSVEIIHVVTNANNVFCESLKLSGSVSGVVTYSLTISGDLEILGGTVDVDLTVGGNTNVVVGVLNRGLRVRNITVNGVFAGTGSILIDRAGAGNTGLFTNNGTVSVLGVRFGADDEAFNYAIGGNGTWNFSQFSIVSLRNTLEVTGTAQMNGGIAVGYDARLIVDGTLTFGAGNLGIASDPVGFRSGGTVVVNGSLNFDGTASIRNDGTLDIPGGRTLNFNGDRFETGISGGAIIGTGTIRFAPSDGSSVFVVIGQIEPGVIIAAGTIEHLSGSTGETTFRGPLVIDAGATFAMTESVIWAHDDVTVNGAITNVGIQGVSATLNFIGNGKTFTNNGSIGNITFLSFFDQNEGQNGPHSQFITGTGPWDVQNINIGTRKADFTLVPTVVTLMNDVTLSGRSLSMVLGSELNIGANTLTYNNPKNFIGKVSGTGLVKIHSTESDSMIGSIFGGANGNLMVDSSMEIASGTVKGAAIFLGGNLTVSANATLSLVSNVNVPTDATFMGVSGDVTVNGTLNTLNGSNGSIGFSGGTFTNNGTITGVHVGFGPPVAGTPVVQNLAGSGSWEGTPRLSIAALSTTTLLDDVNFTGVRFILDGRLNTGPFTFSMPCTVVVSDFLGGGVFSGMGDVVGNIRRTNLPDCPGAAIAYGNAFTTIQITSGTPPDEITFNIALSAPAGLPNAVNRTYLITPNGGSGYTATLRLHYLDSELNGNSEGMLQLWRNNGSTWNALGPGFIDLTQNWIQSAGITEFSPWAISGPPNSSPVLSNLAVTPSVISAGGFTTLSGNVTDTDTGQVVIDWGDGSANTTFNFPAGGTPFSQMHQYNASGTFNIVITATDNNGGSTVGGISITVNEGPPDAPTGLTGTAVSTTQINLVWTDNSDNETGFKIERCGKGRNCANAVEIGQVAANVTTFSNTGLTKATSYKYRVRAFNDGGNSGFSNIASAKTPRR